MRRGAWTLTGLLLVALSLAGARPLHPYRTREDVTKTLAQSAHQGDCDQCHTMHGEGAVVYGHALVGPDENSLCDRCHDTPWAGGSYAGTQSYIGSSHGASPEMVWPGPSPPPRTEPGAARKCLNCHDPHGWGDQTGPIPMLAIGRGDALCLTCHDGDRATANIAADMAKPFRHPGSDYPGRHTGPLESTPADFAIVPQDRRHAECVDCHNPHLASGDRPSTPPPPTLARVDLGVSRVLVQNGAAGSPPTFVFAAGSDTLSVPLAEYQLCFKCHSSWTTPPTGQTDLALDLNPANASYHPVEAAGRNPNIPAAAFAAPWNASSLTRCSDCHGSDFPGAPRGPHGSNNRYLLKQPYEASSQPRAMSPDEMCFTCHNYDVYANPAASDAVQGASRFGRPVTAMGHTGHVAGQNVPCYACHLTHGAPYLPHLIGTGRNPGITTYTETPTGGTCTPTCHAPSSYTVTYAR